MRLLILFLKKNQLGVRQKTPDHGAVRSVTCSVQLIGSAEPRPSFVKVNDYPTHCILLRGLLLYFPIISGWLIGRFLSTASRASGSYKTMIINLRIIVVYIIIIIIIPKWIRFVKEKKNNKWISFCKIDRASH